MALSTAQQQALKADIAADATLSALPNTADGAQAIADAYDQPASPDFYVWRTGVSEAEYTTTSGADAANGGAATTWSWTGYIGRSAGEQAAWARLFMTGGGKANPSLANVRQAIADIFSGNTAPAPAQRNHLTVLSKRRATRLERLFAAGTGSFASPATMAVEGRVSYQDVLNARNS